MIVVDDVSYAITPFCPGRTDANMTIGKIYYQKTSMHCLSIYHVCQYKYRACQASDNITCQSQKHTEYNNSKYARCKDSKPPYIQLKIHQSLKSSVIPLHTSPKEQAGNLRH